jgi:hypothetical protein
VERLLGNIWNYWNNNTEWEIANVKKKGSEQVWVQKVAHEKGEMLEEDELMMLNGVSGKTMEKLNRTGITKVKDMKYLDNHKDTILGICLETRVGDKNGVSPSLGLKLIDQAKDAKDRQAPQEKYH